MNRKSCPRTFYFFLLVGCVFNVEKPSVGWFVSNMHMTSSSSMVHKTVFEIAEF
jgi:hypothetical protein